MVTKEDKQMIEYFSNNYCVVCKRKIKVICGTPVIHIGGCCVGIMHKKENVFHVRTLKAHIDCYLDAKVPKKQKQLIKPVIKLKWDFDEIKQTITKHEGDTQ